MKQTIKEFEKTFYEILNCSEKSQSHPAFPFIQLFKEVSNLQDRIDQVENYIKNSDQQILQMKYRSIAKCFEHIYKEMIRVSKESLNANTSKDLEELQDKILKLREQIKDFQNYVLNDQLINKAHQSNSQKDFNEGLKQSQDHQKQIRQKQKEELEESIKNISKITYLSELDSYNLNFLKWVLEIFYEMDKLEQLKDEILDSNSLTKQYRSITKQFEDISYEFYKSYSLNVVVIKKKLLQMQEQMKNLQNAAFQQTQNYHLQMIMVTTSNYQLLEEHQQNYQGLVLVQFYQNNEEHRIGLVQNQDNQQIDVTRYHFLIKFLFLLLLFFQQKFQKFKNLKLKYVSSQTSSKIFFHILFRISHYSRFFQHKLFLILYQIEQNDSFIVQEITTKKIESKKINKQIKYPKYLKEFYIYQKLQRKNLNKQGVNFLKKPPILLQNMEERQIENIQHRENLEQIKIELQNLGYTDIKHVGSGFFGGVVIANNKQTQERLALKCIKVGYGSQIDQKQLEIAKRENKILQDCDNIGVVKSLGYFIGKNYFFIQLQECVGSFEDLIYQNELLNEVSFIKYAQEIAYGIQHIHDQKYIVKDLKPDNILLTYTGKAVICDLGLASQLRQDNIYASQNEGNFLYKAPEELIQIYSERYRLIGETHSGLQSYQSDVYALGLIFYQLIEGKKRFQKIVLNKDQEVRDFTNLSTFKNKKIIQQLLQDMLQFSPKKRIYSQEVSNILNKLYFNTFDSQLYLNETEFQNLKELYENDDEQHIEYLKMNEQKYIPIISEDLINAFEQSDKSI